MQPRNGLDVSFGHICEINFPGCFRNIIALKNNTYTILDNDTNNTSTCIIVVLPKHGLDIHVHCTHIILYCTLYNFILVILQGGADVTAEVKCTMSLLPPLPGTKTQFIRPVRIHVHVHVYVQCI